MSNRPYLDLNWVAREVLRICMNVRWPEEERFWGRPVLVVSDHGSYSKVWLPWYKAESPLLLSVSFRQLSELNTLDDYDRSQTLRALALSALAAEAA